VCLAVSSGSDAKTSTYNRYSFNVSGVLPANTTLDYPKFGIWPDGYYYTANIFDANSTVIGTSFCAFERAAMLQDAAARAQCVFIDGGLASYLPADLDGPNPPLGASPNFLLDVGHPDSGRSSDELRLRRFQVNWVRPENATLTDPVVINVAPFTPALMPAYPVPQPSPGTPLEAIGDRPMFRLAYRNFGDHETLVVNHTVIVDGRHGVRWYELRPNQNPVVYQQGTYAPGDVFRWVGSIAMDSAGDIAIGYSASSNAIYPAIRYTGRVPGDPSGTLVG